MCASRKSLFDLVDRDSSGTVSFEEFKAGIFMMGFLDRSAEEGQVAPPEGEMRCWFDDADTDGSGEIDFAEFVALVKVEMNPKRRERRRQEAAGLIARDGLGKAPPLVPPDGTILPALAQPPSLPPLLASSALDAPPQLTPPPNPLSPAKPLPSLPPAVPPPAVPPPAVPPLPPPP